MRPEQRVKSAITRVAFVGAALGTVIASFSAMYWFAELFSHFRLYYLMVLALLVLTFLHQQRWLLLGASVLLAVPNAWHVMPYLLPASPVPVAGEGAETVLVAGMNLNYRNDDYAGARAYLDTRSPDVLVLQEYTPRWHDALRAQTSRYPYRVVYPQPGAFGMAVYSRIPLHETRQLDLGVPGAVNLYARLELGDRDVNLYGIHLHPPISPERARFRDVQLRRLSDELARDAGSRLMIGDLNVTPFSPYFDALLSASGLTDARRSQGIHITWPTFPLPVWIAIDHCLADPETAVVDVRRGPAFGSDHYPLEARILAGQ